MTQPDRPFLLGLTGGMGCGKSAAASILAAHGLPCVDADGEGHVLLESPQIKDQVLQSFGRGVLACDGRIARGKLAAVAFADGRRRETLEHILHPAILEACLARARGLAAEGAAVVGLESALLLESGFYKSVDAVLVVDCPLDLAIKRLGELRGFTPEQVLARMAHQMPAAEKRARGDVVVDNEGTLEDLALALRNALQTLAAMPALAQSPAGAFLGGILEAWNGRS
jgi:dephospho-CoA kinase